MDHHRGSSSGSQVRGIFVRQDFLRICGEPDAALLLSQVCYWAGRTNGSGPWFYKTRQQWMAETGLNRMRQEQARSRLRELNFIEERLAGVPARLYFRLNSEAIAAAIDLLALDDLGPTSWQASSQQVGRHQANKLAGIKPTKESESTAQSTSEQPYNLPLKVSSPRKCKPTPLASAEASVQSTTEVECIPPLKSTPPASAQARIPSDEDEVLYKCRLAFWRASRLKLCPSRPSPKVRARFAALVRQHSRGIVLRAVRAFGEEVYGDSNIRMPLALFLSDPDRYLDRVYAEVETEVDWRYDRLSEPIVEKFLQDFSSNGRLSPENMAALKSEEKKLREECKQESFRLLRDRCEEEFLDYNLNWHCWDDDNMLTVEDIDK